jgi:hypothetical protein
MAGFMALTSPWLYPGHRHGREDRRLPTHPTSGEKAPHHYG